jgi:hypothetical protein
MATKAKTGGPNFDALIKAKQAVMDAEAAEKKVKEAEEDRQMRAAFRPVRKLLAWMRDTDVQFPAEHLYGYPRTKEFWAGKSVHSLTQAHKWRNVSEFSAELYYGAAVRVVLAGVSGHPPEVSVRLYDSGIGAPVRFMAPDEAVDFVLDLIAKYSLR